MPRWETFHQIHIIGRVLRRMPACSSLTQAESVPGSPGWHAVDAHLPWLLPPLMQLTCCLRYVWSAEVRLATLLCTVRGELDITLAPRPGCSDCMQVPAQAVSPKVARLACCECLLTAELLVAEPFPLSCSSHAAYTVCGLLRQAQLLIAFLLDMPAFNWMCSLV